ncbi:MAG: hypothetical protein UT84_C0002G0087 [Candidatus Curtissbacteria bacterium GW2011_GWA1_40_16]|uniref:Uncharacterized protein n=1 Tax=Candidatus Curtissbacteria bacterium GW2011_GWA1_40_16 TaxID=1618405 RepID=A0A0G0RMX5_9BACT|nr:MAG: hypothetical protein UT84_C0002G0087 [Candidatus Curtissbacteria bacterium GW2011_GWA1_40_16]
MERSDLLYFNAVRFWRALKPEELPSKAEVSDFIEKAEVSLDELIQNLPQRRAETILELRELRQLKIQAQQSYSRPSLCVDLLRVSVSVPVIREAVDELEQDHKSNFSMLFDLSTGLGEPIGAVKAAEEMVRGTDFAKLIATMGSTQGNHIATQAEIYREAHARISEYADLLKADPSGFTVVDKCLQNLQAQSFTQSNKQIVLVGAKYSAELYKAVYPLSEPVHLV